MADTTRPLTLPLTILLGRSLTSVGRRRVPTINLSASSVAEDAAVNTVIGALSVVNGSGSYTFTELADPDSKFNISGANLRVGAALDYETATSHSVTIQADNGVDTPISRQFTITVTDVSEAAAPMMRFNSNLNSQLLAVLEEF